MKRVKKKKKKKAADTIGPDFACGSSGQYGDP